MMVIFSYHLNAICELLGKSEHCPGDIGMDEFKCDGCTVDCKSCWEYAFKQTIIKTET
jgi:hypothetical protein